MAFRAETETDQTAALLTERTLPPDSLFPNESLIIKKYLNGFDISPIVQDPDPGVNVGRRYEDECFGRTIRELGHRQFALGPGVIDRVLVRRSVIRPDSLIFERVADALLLTKMEEYRMGKTTPGRKLTGFLEYLGRLRQNPGEFRELFEKLTGEALPQIIVPEDESILVDFVTPTRYVNVEPTSFGGLPLRILYSQVLLPKTA